MKYRLYLIDIIRNTSIIKDYNFLIKKQYQSVSFFEEEQKKRLISLLLILKKYNKFYKSYLKCYGNDSIKFNPYKILSNLPITDKKKIKKNFNKIFTKIERRPYQFKRTGGSTGAPFEYYCDKKTISLSWAFIYFFWHKYANYSLGNPFVTIAGNSLHSLKSKFLEKSYYLLQNNYFINADILNNNINLNKKKLKKAKLIYGYPSSIYRLLQIMPNLPSYFKELNAIFTTSEELTPRIRENLENAFNVKVFDMYGANDGGIISCECEKHNGVHYHMLNCYVETFYNEYGYEELLLTSLNSYNFPIVRYRVGDLGTTTKDTCECSLPFFKIQSLKGRTRDMIYVPDTGWLHGSIFNSIFYKYKGITNYKIIQYEDYKIIIYLNITDEIFFEDIIKKLQNVLKNRFAALDIEFKKLDINNPTNKKFKLIESYVN